jgi:hypothetical protein
LSTEGEKKKAWARVKKYGLCKVCQDRVDCSDMCDRKEAEIQEKFFHCLDEFGNTEMYKLKLTKREKIELYETLNYDSLKDHYPALQIYYENKSHYQYRYDKSEDTFKETGVRTPTPDKFTHKEQDDFYMVRSRQKGVCVGCVVQPSCHKICPSKWAEIYDEEDELIERANRISGICQRCKIRAICVYDNCIEREQEIDGKQK